MTYEIQEGARVYVERINIVGNVRTLDKVIRREFRLAEGDAFNTAKLRRTRQRIRNLGFFEKVDITNVPGDTPDRTIINVEVQERSTGELSFGVGFSTADGALADVGIRERNLLGRGQDLRLNLTGSQRRQQLDLSFTEPYFLDKNIAAGVDAFKIQRDFQRESSYDQDSLGLRCAAATRSRNRCARPCVTRCAVTISAMSTRMPRVSSASRKERPSARSSAKSCSTISATTVSIPRMATS